MMQPEISDILLAKDSRVHDRILTACRNRIRASAQRWNQRHEQWRENERLLRSFRSPDDEDRKTRSQSMTEGVQKIVVPYTYAQVQSMLAFLVTIFTDRKPMIPVEPVGPYVKEAIVHEHLLEFQMDSMRPRGLMVMMQWFMDALRYDIGIIKNTWTIREWPDLQRIVVPDGMGGFIDQVIEQDVIAYEGNEAKNISPFDFYPDPQRTLGDWAQGEFVAHRMRKAPHELAVKQEQGHYTGIDLIPRRGTSFHDSFNHLASKSALAETVNMGSTDWVRGMIDEYDAGYVTLHELWWFCKPKELGLPTTRSTDLPTLWVFTIANEQRIIRAEPANLPGRRFPFATIQTNPDIHSPATPSIVETTAGLQYHLSWLFNSRMAAVRKTLNNEMIFDPSMIEQVDWEEPNQAGLWRLTKDHYGTGAAKEAVFPVPVQDVTANHLRDASIVQDLIENTTGANRLIQGLSNTGRRSATEVGAQMSLASGRMKLIGAVYASGFQDWAEIMIANNQMFFAERLNVPVNAAYRDVLREEMMQVTPDMLQGVFRVPFLESGIPTDKAFYANTLREVFTLWMQTPLGQQAAMSINGVEVFIQMLKLLGIRNVQDYILTPGMQMNMQVMPDQQVMDQAQQGNLVPSEAPPAQASDGGAVAQAPPQGPGGG